jgi:hypothetical protein
MIWQPEYFPFIKRVWLLSKRHILVYSIGLTLGFFISFSIALLYIAVGVILLLVTSIFMNRYYLKTLEVNEVEQYVFLEIVKYDKSLSQYQIDIEDVDVKLEEALFSFGPSYIMRIYKNKKMVYQQRETIGWNRNIFVEVYEKVKKMKGQKAYTSWVKRY